MNADAFATDVLRLVGERCEDMGFIQKGATSQAWRIRSDKRTYVLRIIDDAERVADGTVDRFIRKALIAGGGRASEPILDSETAGNRIAGRRWSLDLHVAGDHPSRGGLTRKTCQALGETLAALHRIPAAGCGKARRVGAGHVAGHAGTPLDGVRERFENPLPGIWAENFRHPVLTAAPGLEPLVLNHLDAVTAAVGGREAVVCHTDLHEQQLICAGGDLAALLDFGDASVLNRYWDLGSVLYFHGPRDFSVVFAAYCGNMDAAALDKDLAQSFSVAVAMHHGSRSTQPGKQHRLDRAVRFLCDLLDA